MNSTTNCNEPTFAGVQSGLQALLNAQLLLGNEMLKLVRTPGGIFDSLSNINFPTLKSCCDIPPPCWMPLSLGDICSQMPIGSSGTICLVVTNGDFRSHAYEFVATGKNSGAISFSTASLTLGPKERVAVTATFTLPADNTGKDCRGIGSEVLIWVRGCRDHYLRWIVNEASSTSPCCAEICVNDDPDFVLHWYDHFYTLRLCLGTTAGSANHVRGASP